MSPLFDFKCEECGRVEEQRCSIEKRTEQCLCGGTMERMVGAPAFSIHGPGTEAYETGKEWGPRKRKK